MEDIGVLNDSKRFYCEPDMFTAKNLFYAPHSGIYHCDKSYKVTREYLDTCQIILVDKGSLKIEYKGATKTAHSGMIVLLDCRIPHCYYSTSDDLYMRWFHFMGNCSNAYTDRLLKIHGCVISPSSSFPDIESCCEKILRSCEKGYFSHDSMSVLIHKLLSHLTLITNDKENTYIKRNLENTTAYMDKHYNESSLSIEALAEIAMLSQFYYLKKFKEHFGTTPHKYLVMLRLRKSKEMLTTTVACIEEIAHTCGFSNTSHFISVFRNNTGMTPLQYRTLWK